VLIATDVGERVVDWMPTQGQTKADAFPSFLVGGGLKDYKEF